jgi:hypothetical protein
MTDLKTVADNYDKMVAAATSINMFSGTLDVKKDQVKKRFLLYLPSAYSQYILDWALGFRYSDNNLEYIDTKHILLFAEMVGVSFLERVLAGRSAIQLQADFNISVSFLEKKIGDMKTKLSDELTKSTIVPMIWG